MRSANVAFDRAWAAECEPGVRSPGQSVVAELSPHHRPDSWNEASLQKVALGHHRVRVTGQLFFDSSHSPCIDGKAEAGDPHRSSLWEIHPAYGLDVCPTDACASGGWVALDQWLKSNP